MTTEQQSTAVITWSINDQRIAEVKEEFKHVDAYEDFDSAQEAKKTLTSMRTALTAAHKETKAEALAFGRKCDAEKRRLMSLIAEIEDPITEQIDEIRNREKRAEEERQAKIQAEIDRLRSLSDDRHEMSAEELEERLAQIDSEELDEEVFHERLSEGRAALLEARIAVDSSLDKARQRAAEEARLAEERKRQEAEAKRLAKEREELEAIRRQQEEEQRKKREEEERKAAAERKAEEERLAAERAEIEKQRKEAEEKERKLREEEERLEALRQAKLEAERKAEEERAAEARRLALAPDYDKLQKLATDIAEYPLPQVESDEANAVLQDFVANMKKAIAHLRADSEVLK